VPLLSVNHRNCTTHLRLSQKSSLAGGLSRHPSQTARQTPHPTSPPNDCHDWHQRRSPRRSTLRHARLQLRTELPAPSFFPEQHRLVSLSARALQPPMDSAPASPPRSGCRLFLSPHRRVLAPKGPPPSVDASLLGLEIAQRRSPRDRQSGPRAQTQSQTTPCHRRPPHRSRPAHLFGQTHL
jgi:hypothetical protein